MVKITYSVILALYSALSTLSAAEEPSIVESNRSIIAKSGKEQAEYFDIIGKRNGVDRALIMINGKPALASGTRGDVYFTLNGSPSELKIDCAYVDERNIHNGARIQAAECNLDTILNSEFADIGFNQSNKWKETIFSFNTDSVIDSNRPRSFFLGKIGDIEVYDRYASRDAIVSYAPEKIIKSENGCYRINDRPAFLVFLKGRDSPQYIDVVENSDPMVIARLDNGALNSLAIKECPNDE